MIPKTFPTFLAAMLEAVSFTSCGPDDEAHGAELHPDAVKLLEADALSFWSRCYWMVPTERVTEAGHDFWLTANMHGAGFWDGDWDDWTYGEELDALARKYPARDVYLGDDGFAHLA